MIISISICRVFWELCKTKDLIKHHPLRYNEHLEMHMQISRFSSSLVWILLRHRVTCNYKLVLMLFKTLLGFIVTYTTVSILVLKNIFMKFLLYYCKKYICMYVEVWINKVFLTASYSRKLVQIRCFHFTSLEQLNTLCAADRTNLFVS